MKICNIQGCNEKHKAKGYCQKHYQRTRQKGKYIIDAKERFFNNISPVPECGCWLWTGYVNNRGEYGIFNVKRRKTLAHRFSWELHNGPIPEGLYVLHKCDTPTCVNPMHLFLGTQMDNMQDSIKKGRDKGSDNLAIGRKIKRKLQAASAYMEDR